MLNIINDSLEELDEEFQHLIADDFIQSNISFQKVQVSTTKKRRSDFDQNNADTKDSGIQRMTMRLTDDVAVNLNPD